MTTRRETTRQDRDNIRPAAYQSMMGIESDVRTSGLDHALIEWIKPRASPINPCVFALTCLSKMSDTWVNRSSGLMFSVFGTIKLRKC